MKVLRTLEPELTRSEYSLMAIGVFDGVHRGHREIIRKAVARSKQMGGTAIVLSFYPHPQKVIASGDAPSLLQTFTQQAELLGTLGIGVFISLPFSRELSLYPPEEFVRRIVVPSGAREIHVGSNFKFGHARSGDFKTLSELGRRYGFSVVGTEAVFFRGRRISSTWVRSAVSNGQVTLARRLLGRAYEIRGSVVRGAARGAQLGFPTANLQSDNELLPATGVYVTRASLGERVYAGATNVGFRPTVHGYSEPRPTVETYLFDFTGDIYGQALDLEFCFRLRSEQRFASLEALKHQIRLDIRGSKRYVERVSTFVEGEGKSEH